MKVKNKKISSRGMQSFEPIEHDKIDPHKSCAYNEATGSISITDGKGVINPKIHNHHHHHDMANLCSIVFKAVSHKGDTGSILGVIIETKNPMVQDEWRMLEGPEPVLMKGSNGKVLRVTAIVVGPNPGIVYQGREMVKTEQDKNSLGRHVEAHNKKMKMEGIVMQGNNVVVVPHTEHFNLIDEIYKEQALSGVKEYDITASVNPAAFLVGIESFHKIANISSHFVDLNELRIRLINPSTLLETKERVVIAYQIKYQLVTQKDEHHDIKDDQGHVHNRNSDVRHKNSVLGPQRPTHGKVKGGLGLVKKDI